MKNILFLILQTKYFLSIIFIVLYFLLLDDQDYQDTLRYESVTNTNN